MLGKFSVKKPYTVLVGVILVIVLGVVSFTRMSTDLLPSISLPYVIVMTTYPGASPETVEMVVTKPVEASMATVSNIEQISSVSSENYSVVIMEFAQSTDMNAVSLEIRENLDQIKSFWDDSVGNPIIMKLNPDMLPIMIAAVGGVGMTSAEVSEMTQNTVIPELESIEGVASASATGLLEESVNVIIRQEKIDAINVQVFGYIDDEMEEAVQELADAKQEIYDGQKEIDEAKVELEENKQKLVDSQKELDDSKVELADSKQKIADGKVELEDGKKKLEDGKNELNKQKAETTAQLAKAERQLLTAKADLEAAKMYITMQLTTAQATIDGYKSAVEKLNDTIELYENAVAAINLIDSIPAAGEIDAATRAMLSQILQVDVSGMAADQIRAMLPAAKATMQAIIDGVDEKGGVDALKKQRDEFNAIIAEQELLITTLNEQLPTIEANIAKLDKALTELYKGNLTAAIEFANAQTTITLGEMQMSTLETQLETSEKQI